MAQAPLSGTKILVYRGTPLPRARSVTFQEPLTGCGLVSEAEGARAASPKRAARQPHARAQSSRFAAEPGVHTHGHMRQLWHTVIAAQLNEGALLEYLHIPSCRRALSIV